MRLQEVISIAQRVSNKTTYPINNVDQLVNALGGDNTSAKIGNRNQTAAELRRVPVAYFPITSEEDLVMKLANILEVEGEQIEGVTWGKTQEKTTADTRH